MKILILCRKNSTRSQIAEAFLKSLNPEMEVFSAGTEPDDEINSFTVKVMNELGFDLSNKKPKSTEIFKDIDFDYLITVCSDSIKNRPLFEGNVKKRIYFDFADPSEKYRNEEDFWLNSEE
ncbi:MAG: arsenate reductase ArsC [Candidatus Kapabacteria bacterium]|nr:arsenate reductase ArsC [Candidatus Kapabacteria bacterium]